MAIITDKEDREFRFDPTTGRYRYKDSGKLAPEQAILNLTRRRAEKAGRELESITDMLFKGDMDMESWQKTAAKKIKTMHVENSILGHGGEKYMNNSDFLKTGNTLKQEYKYLRRLSQQIKNGEISGAQAKNRIRQYARRSRASFWEGKEKRQKEAGMKWMKRILGVTDHHCADCLGYAAAGWQPIGTLPKPTRACACGANCLCSVKYAKEKPENDSLKEAYNRFRANIGWVG